MLGYQVILINQAVSNSFVPKLRGQIRFDAFDLQFQKNCLSFGQNF